MPNASGPSARLSARPAFVPTPRSSTGVLLVEAHADTRELYAVWLREHDFRVSVAASAAEALAAVTAELPDVVVVEPMLPGGGPALIRALRTHPATADALIVVLTTQTQPLLREAAIAAGADIYAVKPCGAPRLAQLIELGTRNRTTGARVV